MDKRKGRPHPQPTTYKTEHPYRLLALYTIWDALTELDNAEERAWFNLNNPIFLFWCECAGLDAVEVRDRAYTLVLKADPAAALEMLTQDQHSDCSLTEEAIRSISLDTTIDIKSSIGPRICPPQYMPLVKPPYLLDISRQKSSKVPAKLGTLIMLRDNKLCRYCGASAIGIDHVIPGGEAVEDNLVASCARCNNIKNNRPGFWLQFDPRLKTLAELGKRVWRKGTAPRSRRFYKTHPYGQKGTLRYRDKVVSPKGLFGDALWDYIKEDTNKKGRRKFALRRKRAVSAR